MISNFDTPIRPYDNTSSKRKSDENKLIIDPLKSIFLLGKEVAGYLIGENITSLMHRLDNHENQNLFHIVRFLSNYLSFNIPHSQYEKIYDKYVKIVEGTNQEYYRKKVSDIPKNFVGSVEKFPDYLEMINLLDSLPNYQQNNIINIAYFILYCKKYKLDSPSAHNIWRRYKELIEDIRSLESM